MRDLKKAWENREIEVAKLLEYGFQKSNDSYYYARKLNDNFKMEVVITPGKQQAQVMDLKNNEEYILVDVKTTLGAYASAIKEKYEQILNDIMLKCSHLAIFKGAQTLAIIKYIKEKYAGDLEFLWAKYDAAIWRNRQNQKWYGLLMVIEAEKLGLNSKEKVEIIDLRYPKDQMANIVDEKIIFKGYHMNKKSWLTIILNDSMPNAEIYKLIDISYAIAQSK